VSSDSTATVTFVVTDLERLNCAGRLVALATVEIDLEGVVVVVQGVRVIRDRNRITTQAPRFRNPRTGVWTPAVILPHELGRAIADALQHTLTREAGRMTLPEILGTPLEQAIEDALTNEQAMPHGPRG
jgi:stage V sporulation protein G